MYAANWNSYSALYAPLNPKITFNVPSDKENPVVTDDSDNNEDYDNKNIENDDNSDEVTFKKGVDDTVKDVAEDNDTDSDNTEGQYHIDGKLGASEQGSIGDCWLLSALNGLAATEKGSKIIKDAVTKNDNGYSVKFKAVNTSIDVTEEDLKKYEQTGIYSTGDDDVLLMETAFEKLSKKMASGEIKVSPDMKKRAQNGIESGVYSDAIYLLTGDSTVYHSNDSASGYGKFDKILDTAEANNGNFAANVAMEGYKDKNGKENDFIKDIHGNTSKITGQGESHSCTVKAVEGNSVTIINPWDSSEDIVVSKDELKKFATGITYYEFD